MHCSAAGVFDPLTLLRYPLSSSADGLRQLAAAQHIGKVVVAAPVPAPRKLAGRWLVLGGLGALGLLSARWLASQGGCPVPTFRCIGASCTCTEGSQPGYYCLAGVQHLVLLGRSGRSAAEACDDGPHGWAAAVSRVACDAAMPEDMCQASSRSCMQGKKVAALQS